MTRSGRTSKLFDKPPSRTEALRPLENSGEEVAAGAQKHPNKNKGKGKRRMEGSTALHYSRAKILGEGRTGVAKLGLGGEALT